MKFFFLILLFIISTISYAQKTVDVTTGNTSAMSPAFFNVVGGEPFVFAKFARLVEGSPYFREEWMKGNVILNGERQYAGVNLKLDLFDNEVHYQDQKGNEMIATAPIQKVVLFDSVTQQVFNFINSAYLQTNNRVNGWYQILSEGKVSLFKQIDKQMHETKPYGSATIEQSIITVFHYYVLYNGRFTEIKKIKELPEIFSDKKQDIAQYIKSKSLSGKTDDDFEMVINYFNGLK
ncbi:MAG TPA: hypothetical protein VGQ09_14440 [Chitinophagaceae bacterium]|nr:hypothetical protein [Chitinophagaceae bacterium]